MTSKFSIDNRELLQRISSGEAVVGIDFGNLIVRELAAFRLAAMDSEPVAEVLSNRPGNDTSTIDRALPVGTQLYRHAQPAPVVPAVSDDIGEIRVGRLPTMNQDDYPGLGDWWVQLRIGKDSDEVLARVYGATPQEANNRAEALACRAAMLQAEPVCTCPSGDGSLRWPCPVHPGNYPVIPDSARDALEKALAAMEFMGDTLNNLDAVCTEDVELVAPAFDAVRSVLAAATQEGK